MVPAVDAASCATSDYIMAVQLANAPGVNLSSETPTATAANLTDITDANNIENALAHRGLLRDDDLYVGWSYTPDRAVATYTDLENYNFWLRHYDGATGTWTNPVNMGNITDKGINVREPRLVGTPSGAGQDTSAFVVARGTQTNVPSHLGGEQDLEIFYTRTFDKGVTFEPVVSVPNPAGHARFESQLRPMPDKRPFTRCGTRKAPSMPCSRSAPRPTCLPRAVMAVAVSSAAATAWTRCSRRWCWPRSPGWACEAGNANRPHDNRPRGSSFLTRRHPQGWRFFSPGKAATGILSSRGTRTSLYIVA
jgi:hypothetical protein